MTAADPAPRCSRLDDLLARSAQRTPGAPALAAEGEVVGYGELDTEVTRLAGELRAAGLREGHRVGVHLPKGRAAVPAVYAVLRAGAIAAPLDCADPAERTARAARNAGLDFLLTGPATGSAAHRIRDLLVAETRDADVTEDAGAALTGGLRLLALAPASRPQAGEDAYILFTSGSTGWPKGALLTHGNVLHFVAWAARTLGVEASDRIGSQSALTFDLSTFDLFAASLTGACVVILPEELKAFPRDVVDWLRRERISVFYAVPTLYCALADKGGISASLLPELRVLAFAGEPFPPRTLQWYVGEFTGPGARLWNLYGPTETNVCTGTEVPRGWAAEDGLSIGTAIDGVHVGLTGEDGAPVGAGEEGEIAVAGPTVFRGYLRGGALDDPAEQVRFEDGAVRRAYLTGDLGRRDGQGRIWLRGRRDHQVKVRGHRIDLGDVESAAEAVPGVRACAAVLGRDGQGEGRLLLYVVADGVDERRLRELLAARLPRRMMPDEVRGVGELPLNSRGKVDRLRLAGRS